MPRNALTQVFFITVAVFDSPLSAEREMRESMAHLHELEQNYYRLFLEKIDSLKRSQKRYFCIALNQTC